MSIKEKEKIEVCDLCGGKDAFVFLRTIDFGFSLESFRYMRCKNCTLVWLSPRPRDKFILKYYPNKYKAHQFLKKNSFVHITIQNFFKKNHWVAKLFIKDQLFYKNKKGKILDVGAGNGRYLEILKSWGWDAFGIEINNLAIKNAKNRGIKNIQKGDLFSVNFKKNSFDLLRFSHVLEHVQSPKKQIQRSYLLLKRGGSIVIIIPNIDSLFFRIFRSSWYQLDAPRHTYHFSPKTIRRYLEENNFKSVEIKYFQSPYSLIRSILCLFHRKNIEKRYGLLPFPLAAGLKLLNVFHLSDSIEVTAIK